MNFRTFLESSELSKVAILTTHATSEGHHGWGDVDEYPADDPRKYVEFNIEMKPEIERMVKNYPVVYEDYLTGSYHERFYDGEAYILIPQEFTEILAFARPAGLHFRANRFKPVLNFPFVSIKDTVQKIQAYLKNPNDLIQQPKSSEEYWADIMKIHKASKPRQLDGD